MAIADYIKRHPRLYDKMLAIKRRMGSAPARYHVIKRALDRLPRPRRFLQIGANDGLRNDPLREFVIAGGFRGLFVEPHPVAFQMLRKNYAYLAVSGLQFLQAAVTSANRPGTLELWTFSEPYLNQVGFEERLSLLRKISSNAESLIPYARQPDIAKDAIVQFSVAAFTIAELFRMAGGTPDLLVLDIEGMEGEIIRDIDFDTHRPRIIVYESLHLGDYLPATEHRLRTAGYEITDCGIDAVAVLVR